MANFAISTDTNYSSLVGIANNDSLSGTNRATLTIDTSTVDLSSYFFQSSNILIKNTSTTTPIFNRWNNQMTHRFASKLDIQGELILIGTSDGTANQSFTLPTGFEPDGVTVAKYKDTVALYLNQGETLENGDAYNTVWRQVDSLTNALGDNSRSLGNQYTHNFAANTVTFGDGTNGTIPPSGTPIYIPNIVIEKGATSTLSVFDWACQVSIDINIKNVVFPGNIRLYFASYNENVFEQMSYRAPNLWLVGSNLTQRFKSCALLFSNSGNFVASNNQKFTSCHIHQDATQGRVLVTITGKNTEFLNNTISLENTGAIGGNDICLDLKGKNTIVKNNDFAGRFYNLFRGNNSRDDLVKDNYWETAAKRVATWSSQAANYEGWHLNIISQSNLTIQNTIVRTPSAVGGTSGYGFINSINGSSEGLTIDGLDWGVQTPPCSYYRGVVWGNTSGSTRINNINFDSSGVQTQFIVGARDFECTNINFNNSSGYALGITGSTTNVKLNNAMTLGDNGFVYDNTTFNWSSTLQTSPNDATDGKIVWYYNNFDPGTNPNYFTKLVEVGDIYLAGSRQVQFNTVGDKCQFEGEVHYGIDNFTAIYDGVYLSNALVQFSLRRKNGTYAAFADLTVPNLQTALAALPSDVLKSVQMKLTIEKLTTNTVGVTAPTMTVTVDNAIVVPVYGLWGNTYFPEAGETISTIYDRVIFQESGTYTATVTLPFVDVFNGSSVLLNADSAPTVIQQTDGTITVIAPQAQASVTGIVTGSRLLVYNETKAALVSNDLVAGTSFNLGYDNGTTFSTNDIVRITIEYQSGVTAKKTFLASAVAGDGGWSILAEQVDDNIYIGYGHDGSTITNFTADYVDSELDITFASDWYASEMYSWFVYNKTTALGIHTSAFLTAVDAANLQILGKIDNLSTASLVQLDNIRIFRPDGTYPVKQPSTGGGGVDVVWRNTILIVETGVSGLTPPESSKLLSLNTTGLATEVNATTNKTEIIDAGFNTTDRVKLNSLDTTDLEIITPIIKSNQSTMNEGIKKASKFIPYNGDVS